MNLLMEVISQNQSGRERFQIQAKKYRLRGYQQKMSRAGWNSENQYFKAMPNIQIENNVKRLKTGREREKGICNDI